MPVTDPEAIRYVNEVIRPQAEAFRRLKTMIDAALLTWYGGIDLKIPNNSTPIDDGRESEGVSRLVGSDVTNMVTQMSTFQSQLDQAGVSSVISKACVRPLEVI